MTASRTEECRGNVEWNVEDQVLSGRIDSRNAVLLDLKKDRILSGTHKKVNNLQARPPEKQQQPQQQVEGKWKQKPRK